MMDKKQQFTIQQMADITELSIHTLRYYEQIGLMFNVPRANNGHRRYGLWHINWMTFVKRLRATGMPVAQIAEYAELLQIGTSTIDERLTLLEDHRDALESNIRELQQNLQSINAKITLYKAETADSEARERLRSMAYRRTAKPIDDLPPVIRDFLHCRDADSLWSFLVEQPETPDPMPTQRWLMMHITQYRAFPDYAWNPSGFAQVGDCYYFTVEPTGTHTGTIDFTWMDVPVIVPPTGSPLPRFCADYEIRLCDGKIATIAYVSDNPKQIDEFIAEIGGKNIYHER